MPSITTAFAQGLAASRPAAAASNTGFMWLSTDTAGGTLYQSTGSAWVQLAAGVNPPASAITAGTLAAARGGTGLDASAAANGALLIGNGTGLSLATLTAGTNVTITNSAGGISIASSGGGSSSWSWGTKTANYTLTTTDSGILADATSGALTMTLPTAVGATALYTIKKKDSSANSVTIATTSAQTIDGFSSVTLAAQLQAVTLMSDGSNWYSAPTPATVPAVRCHNSANESISNSTYTTLTFDTNDLDQGTSGQHSTSVNPSRLVCKVAGLYLITCNVTWASNATGYREVFIQKNGTTAIADLEAPAISGAATVQVITTLAVLAVGDYLEAVVFMNAGVALNVAASNGTPSFGWARLG